MMGFTTIGNTSRKRQIMRNAKAIGVVPVLALAAMTTAAPSTPSAVAPAGAPPAPPAVVPVTSPPPPPPAAVVAPPGALVPAKPSVPVMRPDGKLMLNFKDAPVDAILDYLSEAAGLVIVKDGKIDGRITVVSRQPLTVDEAVGVVNTVLKEKGYAAIRTERVLRIVTLDNAKKASVPVHVGNDPAAIAPDDQIITQVVPIRYADANQLKKDLAPLVPTYADLSANVSSNSIIVTDTGANVRRIVEIVRALDTAMSTVSEVRVFTLKFANATNAAKLINDVFKPDTSTSNQPTNPFSRYFRSRGGSSNNSNSSDGTRPSQKVTASADDRTNTLVVSAPPDVMKVIETVLKEIDANPAQDQAVFTYPLKNARADNVEYVINTLFNPNGSTARPAGATTSNANTSRLGGNVSPFSGSGGGGGLGSSSGLGGSRGIGGGGSSGNGFGSTTRTGSSFASSNSSNTRRSSSVSVTGGRISPTGMQTAADLAGQVYAVADEDTNSVLIMTATGNFERVKALLAELDRAVPQVVIKALIAEVTHDDSVDLGVEFAAINLGGNGQTQALTSFGLNAAQAAQGGFIFNLVQNNVDMTLRALQKLGKLEVLSRPYILASDNQEANIFVGQNVPVPTDSRITDTGQTINSFVYQQVGISLDVVPHINPDGVVVMDVAPTISSLTDSTVQIGNNLNAAVFDQRSAQTRVAVRDGQTIVIGGLMEDRKTQSLSGVPFLDQIPILNLLFQRDNSTKTKTELLIFLTPHVARQPDRLQKMSDDERKGATITPNAVEPGAFQRQMEGLQRGADPDAGKPMRPEGIVPIPAPGSNLRLRPAPSVAPTGGATVEPSAPPPPPPPPPGAPE